ncbi:MAG: biotin/lipoyl-containing protein, partial [Gluconobacter oxydans]|uniref:biotin/lipoyl-containing protein n=1 Tax=Gluconobacter oxydans TaxID=442 RepID=UPI0039ECC0BF
MTVEIRVPALGESLTTATVARWLKKSGDYVQHDETIVELETDKVSVEVTAPSGGRLEDCVAVGTEVEIGGLLGAVDETAEAPAAPEPAPVPEAPAAPTAPPAPEP